MARPPSAASILRNTKKAERVVETHSADVASGMVLPNNSGEHKKGIKRDVPINDYDLTNKAYVDTEIDTDIITHKGDASAHHTATVSGDIDHNTTINTHNLTTDIDHDTLLNFELNEHIDWTNTSSSISTIGNITTDNLTITGTLTYDYPDNYITNQRAGNTLYWQNNESGRSAIFEYFTKDGDGTDVVNHNIWVKGTPTQTTNREIFSLQSSQVGGFVMTTASGGNGIIRPIHIRAGGTTEQLVFNVDGTISFPRDNKALKFGVTDTDLQISSDGTNGIIDVATALRIGNITTDYQEIDSNGRVVFVGNAGMVYGTMSVVSNANETAIATQNVYVQVVNFDTNGPNNNSSPDHTNNHITITKAGDYKIECCITANSIAGAGATFEFEVKKNNGTSRVGSAHGDRTLAGGGSEAGAITICTIATLAVNDTIELWTKNESNTQNIIVEDASLSVLQVGG